MAQMFSVESDPLNDLQDMMSQYGAEAEKAVDDILHNEGADEIKQRITQLLPASGRKWKGKKRAASAAMPGAFSQDNDVLSVTIAARNNYGYLYFPDDGSNTRRHMGNQQFMRRGGENATEKIIKLCTAKIVEKIEEGA